MVLEVTGQNAVFLTGDIQFEHTRKEAGTAKLFVKLGGIEGDRYRVLLTSIDDGRNAAGPARVARAPPLPTRSRFSAARLTLSDIAIVSITNDDPAAIRAVAAYTKNSISRTGLKPMIPR